MLWESRSFSAANFTHNSLLADSRSGPLSAVQVEVNYPVRHLLFVLPSLSNIRSHLTSQQRVKPLTCHRSEFWE